MPKTELGLLVSLPSTKESVELLAKQLNWDDDARGRALSFYERGLPPLVDKWTLPFVFGVSPRLINAMRRRTSRYYRTFRIPKRTGGSREIKAPRRFIKLLQRWIAGNILEHVELPDCVMGFRRGRSIFGNGRLHVAGRNLMVVDIEDFFPSIHHGAVHDVFSGLGYDDEVCRQLSDLCTLDDVLPQGAPTSPMLANAVFQTLDDKLQKLADRWRCSYSRYADDLAFSGNIRFRASHIRTIARTLATQGFQVNRRKCRVIGRGGRQIVAGVVVNEKAQPPRRKRRIWRAMFHKAEAGALNPSGSPATLLGVAAFVNQYDPLLARSYKRIAEHLRAH